jgi:polyphosphate kinase
MSDSTRAGAAPGVTSPRDPRRGAEGTRGADGGTTPVGKLVRKDYERDLAKLHGELVTLQRWIQATGAKIVIVFDGRDGAGKVGTIKALTERVMGPCTERGGRCQDEDGFADG